MKYGRDGAVELEVLAETVHTVLGSLHLLAFFYNLRKGNKADCAIHASVAAYDFYAASQHHQASITLSQVLQR